MNIRSWFSFGIIAWVSLLINSSLWFEITIIILVSFFIVLVLVSLGKIIDLLTDIKYDTKGWIVENIIRLQEILLWLENRTLFKETADGIMESIDKIVKK